MKCKVHYIEMEKIDLRYTTYVGPYKYMHVCKLCDGKRKKCQKK